MEQGKLILYSNRPQAEVWTNRGLIICRDKICFFSSVQSGSWTYLTSHSVDIGEVFLREGSGRNVQWTVHPISLSNLKIRIPLALLPHTPSWISQGQIYFHYKSENNLTNVL